MGFLKLNFKGMSFGNMGLAGFGCVIRDGNRLIIMVVCGLLGICDSMKEEVLVLLMGLCELKQLDAMGRHVEGDSMVVVQWDIGLALGSLQLTHYILEIRLIIRTLDLSLSHILRMANEIPDGLAKNGLSCPWCLKDQCFLFDLYLFFVFFFSYFCYFFFSSFNKIVIH